MSILNGGNCIHTDLYPRMTEINPLLGFAPIIRLALVGFSEFDPRMTSLFWPVRKNVEDSSTRNFKTKRVRYFRHVLLPYMIKKNELNKICLLDFNFFGDHFFIVWGRIIQKNVELVCLTSFNGWMKKLWFSPTLCSYQDHNPHNPWWSSYRWHENRKVLSPRKCQDCCFECTVPNEK